jgi:hypothetical protein
MDPSPEEGDMRTLIVPRVDLDEEPRDEEGADLAPKDPALAEPARVIHTHPRGNGELEPGVAAASEARLERVLGW